jgi:hypothetical protein
MRCKRVIDDIPNFVRSVPVLRVTDGNREMAARCGCFSTDDLKSDHIEKEIP